MFKGMTQQQIRNISYPNFNKLVKAAVTKSAGAKLNQ